MMTERITAVQQRREALVARAEAQRHTLGRLVQPWQTTITLADSGLTLARELRAHWFTVAAGTTLLTWMGRGRLGVWIGRLWMGWYLYGSLRNQGSGRQP